MRRRLRWGSVVTLALLGLSTTVPVRAASPTPVPSGARAAVTALADRLRVVAAPGSIPAPCETTFERPTELSAELVCAPVATDSEGGGTTAGGFSLGERWALQTPRWYASLAGAEGDGFVRVHGYGDVAAHRSDGSLLWSRPSMSFFADWDLDQFIVPVVALGWDPIDPRAFASERPYAVGDLDGDSVDDVAVAHVVTLFDGNKQISVSALSVLDGGTGTMRWHRFTPGPVSQLAVVDDVLIVGTETGDPGRRPPGTPGGGEAGTASTLTGLAFDDDHGELRARELWSRSTGKQWARWLALEPAGQGRVAAAWLDKPVGDASGVPGHTMTVDARSGSLVWSRDNAGYPRLIRYHEATDLLVVAEQDDPYVPASTTPTTDYRSSYSLVGLGASDGSVRGTVTRSDAVLLSLAVADIASSPGAEWVAGEAIITALPGGSGDAVTGSRVTALVPGAGAAWTDENRWCTQDLPVGRMCDVASATLPYGLHADDERDMVIEADLTGTGSGLIARSGADGRSLWTRAGDPAFPLFLVGRRDGSLLTATPDLALRSYDLDSGATRWSAPLPYELHAADTFDVNADGVRDVIAGGQNGVFAFDGRDGGAEPRMLWSAEATGAVHELEVTDLGGDDRVEVVVAATSSISVFDAATGAARPELSIAYPDDYVWTFTTGDLTGDGKADLVVPTRTLAAYDGKTGARAWEFEATKPNVPAYFSSAVITPDRRVAAQFVTQSGVPFLNSRSHQVAVAVDGPTGNAAWVRGAASRFSIVDLWRSVVIDPAHPCGAGVAVGFTWDESSDVPIGWHPRTDFYDSASGLPCYTAGPLPEGAVDMGTVYIPGPGVLEFNWFNVAQLRPDGVTEVHFAPENAATSDIAMADFGPRGKAFLKAWTGIQAYGPNSPTGADGDDPASLAEWFDLFTGRMHADDVDDDGSDEIVALPFDWDAYARVAAMSGSGVGHFDLLPHGIALLEAR